MDSGVGVEKLIKCKAHEWKLFTKQDPVCGGAGGVSTPGEGAIRVIFASFKGEMSNLLSPQFYQQSRGRETSGTTFTLDQG